MKIVDIMYLWSQSYSTQWKKTKVTDLSNRGALVKENEIKACSYINIVLLSYNNELLLFDGTNGRSKPYEDVNYHASSVYLELNNCKNTFKS